MEYLISNHITEAIAWTILQLLWQGAIVSLLLALVLQLAKDLSAKFRYNLSIFALIVIIGLTVNGFISYQDTITNKQLHNKL